MFFYMLMKFSLARLCGGYASILEFGSIALSNELAWLPICAVPSNHVSGIEAGISQVFVKILQQFFLNPICNVGSGLRLKGKEAGDSCTLFLQLGGLLQDGQAQKLVYSSKGDGGSRLCIMCANLYSEKTDICGEDTVLKCQLIDEKDLILTSDEDIRQSMRKLVELKDEMTKLWQQSCGFSYEPASLLFDSSFLQIIKPVTHYIHDWMHCVAVNGVFHTCFYDWLLQMQQFQDIYPFLQDYLKKWNLPRGKNANLHRLFNDKRKASNQAAFAFGCSGSEVLGLLPILCYYMQNVLVPAGIRVKEGHVLLALVEVMELLQSIPVMNVEPASLKEAVAVFYTSIKRAEWGHIAHSKFHWLQHLPTNMGRLGNRLPSRWCHER